MKKDPIVVIGGGFGGVYATKKLLKLGHPVFLISKTNHFSFTPLLHEVATGGLVTPDITFEYESFFRSDAFEFIRAEVTSVDPQNKTVHMNDRSMKYRALILASGAITNPFKIRGVEHGYELKTATDAVRLKNAILEKAQSPEKKVSVTIIGGGATGVELFFEINRLFLALKKRHAHLETTLTMVHSRKSLGGMTTPKVQAYIDKVLSDCDCTVMYETYAEEIRSHEVLTTHGTVRSDITVLASGVKPNTEFLKDSFELDERGHINVSSSLQVNGFEHVFAIGDIITIDGQPVPKLAQTASREAVVAARNVHRFLNGGKLIDYNPKVMGMLLSLGTGQGVGKIFGVVVKGVFAWYLWRTIYLFKTPGMVNKLRVAFSWTLGLFHGRNLTSL